MISDHQKNVIATQDEVRDLARANNATAPVREPGARTNRETHSTPRIAFA